MQKIREIMLCSGPNRDYFGHKIPKETTVDVSVNSQVLSVVPVIYADATGKAIDVKAYVEENSENSRVKKSIALVRPGEHLPTDVGWAFVNTFVLPLEDCPMDKRVVHAYVRVC